MSNDIERDLIDELVEFHQSGVESMMIKIKTLEQQIEKMKCCGNCENVTNIFDAISDNFKDKEACDTCEDNSNWKLKQDEE